MHLLTLTGHPTNRPIIAALAVAFMLIEFGLTRLLRPHAQASIHANAVRDVCEVIDVVDASRPSEARVRHHLQDTHDWRESAASVGVAIGQAMVRVLEAGVIAVPFAWASTNRLFEFDTFRPTTLALLFLATEFAYYWHHRASHRVRWFWATHSVHHSATRLNFTAAIRLGWTGNLSGTFLFFLPLVWIGFEPVAVVGMLGANLLYQFFIHTELVPTLGPFEWIFNTPAQHRVHHATNASCIDRNYGGVLSIFDRLFGTFAQAPRDEPLRYGLIGVEPSHDPVRIALGGWARLLTDVRAADGGPARARVLFGPPGPQLPSPNKAPLPRGGSTPMWR